MRDARCDDRAAPLHRRTMLLWSTLKWLAPSALLVAMPKCPLCLAAYVALFTGMGLSLAAAYYARWGLIVFCVTLLVWQALRLAMKLRRRAFTRPLVTLQIHYDPQQK